ncbi:hypothetical protein [Vibrio sp. SCSIO 43136]|uniref:hypothetical protein n=1 Tax=Vibrio sp. SCSIO 43136 TaxID=2819101 RepID=UPI0020752EA3|nr:hypothetical protein [Vibrio sp. SCSIO 43136]USD65227.1 hypothetical protein J4N39_14445 [Vibrio sp. SCSIO 43136]
MTKRLCKYNRRDIAAELGTIHQVVAAPKFVCHSCSRAANDKTRLCKPASLPNHSLAHAVANPQSAVRLVPTEVTEQTSKPVETIKASKGQKADKAEKKALKKQNKQLKKIKKSLKKQQKLLKKLAKVEKRSQKLQQQLTLKPFELAQAPRQALH